MRYQTLDRAFRSAGATVLALIVASAFAGPAVAGSGGAGLGSSPSTGSAPNNSANNARPRAGDSRHLGDRVLRQGMKGHDVRVLQDYLTLAGYPTTIDGTFGPTTKRNVIAFQSSRGTTPNGVVTIPVELALRAVVAAIEANPPTGKTRINADGTATAPAGAPPIVQAVVAAANKIIHTSYCFAGGHASWKSSCYDCSGSVSFALHGGGLLSSPEDSTELESFGSPGPGRWITIYANSGHTWIVVAGRAFDTANFGGPNIPGGDGPRWRSDPLGNFGDGTSYIIRHPAGL